MQCQMSWDVVLPKEYSVCTFLFAQLFRSHSIYLYSKVLFRSFWPVRIIIPSVWLVEVRRCVCILALVASIILLCFSLHLCVHSPSPPLLFPSSAPWVLTPSLSYKTALILRTFTEERFIFVRLQEIRVWLLQPPWTASCQAQAPNWKVCGEYKEIFKYS